MNDLDLLKKFFEEEEEKLKTQHQELIDNFVNLDLENNILSQINEELIDYFKEILNDLNLSLDEQESIKKAFTYYENIRRLKIDLNQLFIEDKKVKEFKEKIRLLYKKNLERKDRMISNITLELDECHKNLIRINKLKELLEADDINLEEVYDLISLIPINNLNKQKLYKDFYVKQIKNYQQPAKSIEQDVTQLLDEIVNQTEDIPEIEERIEEEGIKLEITEKDRKLENDIAILINNVKKLDNKFPTDIYKDATDENLFLQKERMRLNELLENVSLLENKLETYFRDKDTIWDSAYEKEEVESELDNIYLGILEQYQYYNKIYQEIYESYRKRIEKNTRENLENESDEITEYPPILFWFGNNEIVNEDNYEEVDKSLNEFDSYPEENFYKDDLLPVLNLLKKQSSFVEFKNNGFAVNTIKEVNGVKNAIPFREIKMRQGSGGTARIYYNTIKSDTGKVFIIVYMISNKHEDYDTEAYQRVEGYLKAKVYQKNLSTLLDTDENIIEQFQQLEDYVFQKVKEKVMKQQNVGGAK